MDQKRIAAGESQSLITVGDDAVWKMDLDAFVPAPEGWITVGSVAYPIYHFLDLPIVDSLKVVRLSKDIEDAATYEERMSRSIDQTVLLNAPARHAGLPELARETVAAMSPRAIVALAALASSAAKIGKGEATEGKPQADASPSPGPSPASAGSTDGAQQSSSA